MSSLKKLNLDVICNTVIPCKVTEECRPYGLYETTCMIKNRNQKITVSTY